MPDYLSAIIIVLRVPPDLLLIAAIDAIIFALPQILRFYACFSFYVLLMFFIFAFIIFHFFRLMFILLIFHFQFVCGISLPCL